MRLTKAGLLSCILVTLLVGCTYISAEVEERQPVRGRKRNFYVEGDVIETASVEQETQSVSDEKGDFVWSSDKIHGDIFNLMKELKNNNLISTDIIYLNPKDKETVSVYDALELYGLLKGKKTKNGSKIAFNSNDELAVLLGFKNSEYLSRVQSSELINGSKQFDNAADSRQFFYDAQCNRCNAEDAVISFEFTKDECVVLTSGVNLVNVLDVESSKGAYAVFMCGIEKACQVGSELLLYTEDGYKVYINSESFVQSMGNKKYCYLNKIEGWEEVYGFAVSTSFIAEDYSSNSECVAVMYNAFNAENVWDVHLHKEKPLISIKAILQRYVIV